LLKSIGADYERVYKTGQGKVERSEYGTYFAIKEYTDWRVSDEWIEDAPADLIDELLVRIEKQTVAERARRRQAEQQGRKR